jgi:hypothetical protein
MPRGKTDPNKDNGHPIAYARFLPEIRAYLGKHPDATFEDVKKTLGIAGLSKPWFLVIKSELQRKGTGNSGLVSTVLYGKTSGHMVVEILETIDSSKLSIELKEHYRTHILPMIKRLHPDGPTIHWTFLSDPPCIEIRKMVG